MQRQQRHSKNSSFYIGRPNRAQVVFLLPLAIVAILTVGCKAWKINSAKDRLTASNFRNWSPEFDRVSRMVKNGNRIQIINIRNNQYLTEKDYVVRYYDREFDLDQIRSVDYIVVPFNETPLLAHTMLSFGLDDGTYLVVSVEIRTEKEEEYSPMLGLSRQYELAYVLADEKDVIRLRTRHRDAKVYIYPTVATAKQSQMLFLDVMNRANALADNPEFYDTITNNCTTNLVKHVNSIKKSSIPFTWQVLFPGHSDRYAYKLGLLDRNIPFETLKQKSLVNELADRHFDAADFSKQIRTVSHSSSIVDEFEGQKIGQDWFRAAKSSVKPIDGLRSLFSTPRFQP